MDDGDKYGRVPFAGFLIQAGPTPTGPLQVTAMMKMTDLMHLPGLRFLDLEQVTLQEFLRCCRSLK